ncbi:RNA pseudouridine synthase [Hydrogenophaga sp.]|uniref:RNA pseudouridine synthase n=1 Tax=Hydrogenophaga sp. TaxID=1904254 RepID=UPI0035B2F488
MGDAADANDVRLSKRVAAQLGCSRSEAERLIVAGRVRVDGALVDVPEARVRPAQTVGVDTGTALPPAQQVTLLWHKPAGVPIPEGLHLPVPEALAWFSPERQSGAGRSVPTPQREHLHRLHPLLPLAAGESGLMVFTQSLGVTRKLGEVSGDLEHEWLVDLPDAALSNDAAWRDAVLRSLAQPVSFNGRSLMPARVSWQSERRLRLAIKGCLPGQLAYVLQRAGIEAGVRRRQRLGRVALSGLDEGRWRYLLPTERF